MSRFEPVHIVLMGVSGCGKSTVGAAISHRTGLPYVDGDDLHTFANVRKMRSGQPLADVDRWPWLARCSDALRTATGGAILACSALRRSYRDALRNGSGRPDLLFVHLTGDTDLLHARIAARQGHYMPSTLLLSQIDTLEQPEPDENVLSVDIDRPVEAQVDQILAHCSAH